MSLMNTIKTGIAKLAEYDVRRHASMLKWTTLIIWTCSLIAEVGTFYFNKKLPPKEKRFIVKQELIAGGISLLATYLLADPAEKYGEKLVEEGQVLPSGFPNHLRKPEIIKKVLAGDTETIKTLAESERVWATKLRQFQKGVSVATGAVGIIIGLNIVTPLISNKIASYFHNKTLKKTPSPVARENPVPLSPKALTRPSPTASYPNMYSQVWSR